ncbi:MULTISPECIES: SDH family Clp fold serine proteinase [Enterobacter cloacae complex]|uniref:SDH family Clp fold serine proteinase n=1 Tax=Enterobacter cloacae complex TaxID=354276 RepID=UPI0010225F17|nr:serine dehydrogenasease [Enterobacter hormaechei]MCU2796162.1 serine dehydrogenasease [Enterobacter hormaechei subsp. xiangfangensis]ELS4579095.1 serine dehydrogenasease [Enterobacter hormaechei]MCE1896993.1 serine dehydrogenasease [Enterobacter hormaechei]MCE1910261.1 serine dehydrogenasease [Enterobacter hormaechei]MCE1928626.1 serine dehydrogenasease [Enterobacter hormaechei]
MTNLDEEIEGFITFKIDELKNNHFPNSDVIVYYGGITEWAKNIYQPVLEEIGKEALKKNKKSLVIILSTAGGSVESVEKMVEITRHFYEEVSFIVPDYAMSAGTIWCMSGDKIYMDYASSLGPIDPQVQSSEGKWVPALGYLDKVEEIINKSRMGAVTQAELMMLNSLDLAQLRRYEQARELSKDLLKKWLVEYKFRNWNLRETTQSEVTIEDKIARAEDIAIALSDNRRWHSHGRFIGVDTLRKDLNLQIEDYTDNERLSEDIREVDKMLTEFRFRVQKEIVVISSYPDDTFSDE